MKKFQFSLERMLDFKDQILEKEKIVLGQIKRKQADLEASIRRLTEKGAELAEQLRQEEERGTTVLIIRSYSAQIENIRCQIKDLEAELADVRYQADCQTQVVVAASQEVSSLEKLQERQLEEYRMEERREDRETILEYVITQMSY